MIVEHQPHMLSNHIDFICDKCNKVVHESGKCALARTLHYITKFLTLNKDHECIFKEKCLDWLISDEHVACKMYAI